MSSLSCKDLWSCPTPVSSSGSIIAASLVLVRQNVVGLATQVGLTICTTSFHQALKQFGAYIAPVGEAGVSICLSTNKVFV